MQVLVATWIARFGSCPHAIEDKRSVLQVEAQTCEMVIPVRVFDDDLYLGIYSLCRTHHQVTASLIHQLQAIFSPSHVAFGSNFCWTLATCKEEVVEQELIEMLRCMLGNVLHNFPVLRVRVAECFKIIALVNGISDTASYFQSLLEEEVLRFLKGSIIHNQQVTMCLQINLIHIQLFRDSLPSRFQPLSVFHLVHLVGANINRHLKVSVLSLNHAYSKEARKQAEAYFP